jgi:hypothetical protein
MAAAPQAVGVNPQPSGGTDRESPGSVSFLRGSGRGRYTFEVQSGLTLQTTAQDIGPIDIKAYDYMRSISLLVQCSTAGSGTATSVYAADGPFNAVTYARVKQPNGQTMFSVTSGFHLAMIHKHGLYRQYNDPYATCSESRSSLTFGTRWAPCRTRMRPHRSRSNWGLTPWRTSLRPPPGLPPPSRSLRFLRRMTSPRRRWTDSPPRPPRPT